MNKVFVLYCYYRGNLQDNEEKGKSDITIKCILTLIHISFKNANNSIGKKLIIIRIIRGWWGNYVNFFLPSFSCNGNIFGAAIYIGRIPSLTFPSENFSAFCFNLGNNKFANFF